MEAQTTSTYKLCEHILASGKSCGSPAMRGMHLCYYHRRNRPIRGRELVTSLQTRREIQKALSNICVALGSNRLSCEEASKLIYAVQTAMMTMK
jgi:hypothetical protein